jgi:hypothetical protein
MAVLVNSSSGFSKTSQKGGTWTSVVLSQRPQRIESISNKPSGEQLDLPRHILFVHLFDFISVSFCMLLFERTVKIVCIEFVLLKWKEREKFSLSYIG